MTCRYCTGEAHPDEIDGLLTDTCHECGVESMSVRQPAFWTVAVYNVDRAYGGPEEGGWWYDYEILSSDGEHLKKTKMFEEEDRARTYAGLLQGELDRDEPDNKISIGSVLSRGNWRAIVTKEFPHERWPTVKPHYE